MTIKKINIKKEILVIITVLLFITCMPQVVFAAGEYHVTDTMSFYDCWSNAIKDKGSTIVLDRDMTIEWNGYVLEDDADITIDLNGHSIKGTGSNAESIFTVDDEAKLTIEDNSTTQNGYITIENKTGKYKYVIYVADDDARLVLNSGTLKGNDDVKTRIVYVDDGTFEINGGAVSDNIYEGFGSGVYIDEGSFYMNGGEICYNTANKQGDYNGCGGGVYYDGGSSTKFIMTGGEIHHNVATSGGGIYFADGGKYTTFGSGEALLTGGEIHRNEAKYGGGIFMDDNSDGVELAGNLSIYYNEAYSEGDGGGVYVHRQDAFLSDCTAIIGGSVQIIDNYNGNVYCDPRYDAIEINEKTIDTTPNNHAWVGVSSLEKYYPMDRDQNYYDYSFNEGDKDDLNNFKMYSTCFFSREPFGDNGQTILVRKDGGDVEFVLTHTEKQMRGVYIDQEAIVGKDGQRLINGYDKDYTIDSHDIDTLTYRISSDKGMVLDENTNLLYTNRKECKGIVLQKVDGKYVQKEDKEGYTEYTLYYLVINERYNSEHDRTYYQNYYETVIIDVLDHEVSFNLNGHGKDAIQSELISDWDKAYMPDEPEDEDYDFVGWYTDAECIERFDFNEPITEDTTLYAGWATLGPAPLPCAVYFDMNNHGTQIDPSWAIPGGYVEDIPTSPIEEGWTFGGWYKEPECINIWNFATDKVYEDITLYAKWTQIIPTPEPGKNIVNFEMNGHGEQVAYQEVENNEKAERPNPNPSEEGYDFEGWFIEKECINTFDFDNTLITENITLYAKWTMKANTFEVTFNANYSGSTYDEKVIETYGSNYILPNTNPERTDYVFLGWYTEPAFGEKVTADTIVNKNVAHTIYAQWKQIKEATFNPPEPLNNLEYIGEEQTIAYTGTTKDGIMHYAVTNKADDVIADGDWKESIDKKTDVGIYYIHYYVEGDEYHKDSTPSYVVSEIKKGEPEYTAPKPIFYLVENGSPQTIAIPGSSVDGVMYYAVTDKADDTIADGDWKSSIDEKTSAGTYYVHYYVKGDNNHKDTSPKVFSVTILQEAVYFNVSFETNGHGTIAPQTIEAGKTIKKPEITSKDNYELVGWYKEVDLKNEWDFEKDLVTNDTILYAKWIKKDPYIPPYVVPNTGV